MLKLKSERIKRGLSQQELAVKTKLGYSEISKLESGRMIPYPGQLKKLIKYFKLSGEELFKDDEVNKNGEV